MKIIWLLIYTGCFTSSLHQGTLFCSMNAPVFELVVSLPVQWPLHLMEEFECCASSMIWQTLLVDQCKLITNCCTLVLGGMCNEI